MEPLIDFRRLLSHAVGVMTIPVSADRPRINQPQQFGNDRGSRKVVMGFEADSNSEPFGERNNMFKHLCRRFDESAEGDSRHVHNSIQRVRSANLAR